MMIEFVEYCFSELVSDKLGTNRIALFDNSSNAVPLSHRGYIILLLVGRHEECCRDILQQQKTYVVHTEATFSRDV